MRRDGIVNYRDYRWRRLSAEGKISMSQSGMFSKTTMSLGEREDDEGDVPFEEDGLGNRDDDSRKEGWMRWTTTGVLTRTRNRDYG